MAEKKLLDRVCPVCEIEFVAISRESPSLPAINSYYESQCRLYFCSEECRQEYLDYVNETNSCEELDFAH